MSLTERLAILVTADGSGAVREFERIGASAERDIGKADNRADKLGATMTRTGALMVGAGALMVAGLANAAKASMNLNEEVSQSAQIFDDAAGKVQEFAKGAVAIGQSERAAAAAANTFGLFFTNAGKASDEAADMSIKMSVLASDMASFKNTTPEQAVEALGSALRGESEPIRRYGVMLDEATLKQRALDMGLVETATGTLPPAVKMQAAYAEILAQTSTIQGDFARTADSGANAQRKMAAEAENAKAAIGEGFAPILTKAYEAAGLFGRALSSANEQTGGLASSLLAYGSIGLVVGGALTSMVGHLITMRASFGKTLTSAKVFATGMATVSGVVNALSFAGGLLVLGLLAKSALDGAAAARKAADAWGGGSGSLDDRIRSAEASLDDWNRVMETSQSLSIGPVNIFATSDMADNADRQQAAQELVDRLRDQKTAADGAADAVGSNGLAGAQKDAADATANHADKAETLTGKIREMMDPLFGAYQAFEDNKDAQKDVDAALYGLFLTQLAYDDALANGGPTSERARVLADELAAAQVKVDEAQIASAKSAMDTEAATATLSAAMADGSVKFDDARAKLDEWVAAGLITQGTADTVAAKLGLVAWNAGLIPPGKSTTITTPGADEAIQKFNSLRDAINRVPLFTRVEVNGFVSTTFGPGASAGISKFLVPGSAMGGRPDGPRLVGELGPEIFWPDKAGTIIPAGQTAAMTGGGGSSRPEVIQVILDGRVIAEATRPHLRQLDRANV